MAVEGWQTGSTVGKILGLRFLIGDGLRKRDPSLESDGPFMRWVGEWLVHIVLVVMIGCYIVLGVFHSPYVA